MGHSPLASIHIRLAATVALARLLLEHYDRVRADRAVRHFLFTATFDDGITFEDAPVVDFARIELEVRRLLKGLGLDAVCVFELDVLSKPLPGGLPDYCCFTYMLSVGHVTTDLRRKGRA